MNKISIKNKIVAIILSVSMIVSLVPSFSLTFTAETGTEAPVCTCGTENDTHAVDCALSVTPEPIVCPTCGVTGCTSTHENWCDTCEKDNCGVDHTITAPELCPNCNQEVCTCPKVELCQICSAENCEIDHVYCEICQKHDCGVDHTVAPNCEICSVENCETDHVYCEICQKYDCGVDHTVAQNCEICSAENCETDHVYCEICQKHDCGVDHTVSQNCEICGAENCETDHVYCETCQKHDCGVDHTITAPELCPNCNKESCECTLSMAPAPSVFAELMAVQTIEQMYEKLYFDNYIMQIENLTADELSALSAHVDAIYNPGTDLFDDYEMVKDGIGSFTGSYDDNGAEVLLPTTDGYIYFDLYYGDVTITDNSFSGYVGNGTAGGKKTVSGTHNANNKYYIFQSNGEAYTDIPQYSRVTYAGKSWGEYITNNDNVEAVINAWNEVAPAVDRVKTNNIVNIDGTSGGSFDITIDDIWACDNAYYYSASRETAGITFKSGNGNAQMTLTLVDDNRVNAVHYWSNEGTNGEFIIQGNGSLTAANEDTTTKVNNHNADDKNYIGKNYWCSAIGGNDSGQSDSDGIVIKGGVIYAGTTAADNCTAIGGGGNEFGGVTITGGTVTAVASTTGTAIGGGIGYHSYGGDADVVITGGNVYAYNHSTKQLVNGDYFVVPAAAIGGGSSFESDGNENTKVRITGGNVYAQSIHGVAIGGGGSATKNGGAATVTITGGNVTAISKAGSVKGTPINDVAATTVNAGASIGGGTGMLSGGSATVVIGEAINHTGPVINTGSIGGGKANKAESPVGYADVEVHGGTIHGQVVMAAGGTQPCRFYMTGGVIDNKNNENVYWVGADNPDTTKTYAFLEGNGGAVSVINGTATIVGGTIQNTKNVLRQGGVGAGGGAVYVNNGKFVMNGGTIQNCDGHNGGAVLVYDGTVTIDGTSANSENIPTIKKNTAADGGGVMAWGNNSNIIVKNAIIQENASKSNGGGIYAYQGGSITLNEGTQVLDNTAFTYGGGAYASSGNITVTGTIISGNEAKYGAGAAVANGSITMNSGEISRNIASENGGGAYVSGGNFLLYTGTIGGNSKEFANKAINGAGVYVTGGQFDMISGFMENNVATSHGGGAYVHGGNITIGVENCNAQGGNHSVEYTLLPHPVVLNNDASFGGGLAADGGEINIYCGQIKTNTADNGGMGHNIFMYDQDTTDGQTPKLNHINGQVGSDTDHGMVVIGGDMNITYKDGQLKITINYHDNGKDLKFEIWVGEAPEEYYLNLPYCPPEWEASQILNGLTFVGWTYDTKAKSEEDVTDVVDLSFIRDKTDYRALGDPVKIRRVDWKKKVITENNETKEVYYIDFYAVWAPLTNKVTYNSEIKDYGKTVFGSDSSPSTTVFGHKTEEYEYDLAAQYITMINPSKDGYTFIGWKLTPSEKTISNWDIQCDHTEDTKDESVTYLLNPTSGSNSGTAALANYSYAYSADGTTFTITTDRNFGDITMTALFVENTVTYNFEAISKEGLTSGFGSLKVKDVADDKYEDKGLTYSYTIGQVTGTPIPVTAVPNSPTFRFDGWYGKSDGTEDVRDATVDGAVITPENKPYDENIEITYYALIEYNLTSLTVKLSNHGELTNVTGDSESVIVKVTNGEDKNFYIALDADNGFEATIYGVIVGDTYTVTEENDWTWRYAEASQESHVILPPTDETNLNNLVEISIGAETTPEWLGGDNYAVNKFAPYSSQSNS